jgi:hypothetical protein
VVDPVIEVPAIKSSVMIKNYLLLAIKNMRKQQLFSVINILDSLLALPVA